MSVDVLDGDTKAVQIEGANCLYVLSVVARDGLEVSVFDNSKVDLADLKETLRQALTEKYPTVLMRAESSSGGVSRWEALEPKVFVSRLPG